MGNKKIPKGPLKSKPTTCITKTRQTQPTRRTDSRAKYHDSEPSIITEICSLRVHGPLAIFTFPCRKTQHDAFARLAAFYESSGNAGRYISLEEAERMRLCQNYEAYNVPTSVVREWLGVMRAAAVEVGKATWNSDKKTTTNTTTTAHQCTQKRGVDSREEWWVTLTNKAETQLLAYLNQLGCLNSTELRSQLPNRAIASCKTVLPTYIIAITSARALPHEALHALYFLHKDYRECAQKAWNGLSKRCQAIIQQDMKQRGYAPHIWVDEFQAYVSEDEEIFGKRAREECSPAKRLLLSAQKVAWHDLKLDVDQFLEGGLNIAKEKE